MAASRRPLPIGIHVFPTRFSEQIRASNSLFHYSLPEKKHVAREPPEDYEYTTSYRREPTPPTISSAVKDVRAVSLADSKKKLSVPVEEEPRNLIVEADSWKRGRTKVQEQTHLIHDVIQEGQREETSGRVGRASTLMESDEVLDDLDEVLDQQLTFDEIRHKIMDKNLSFRQYAEFPAEKKNSSEPEGTESDDEQNCPDQGNRTRNPQELGDRIRRQAEREGTVPGGSNLAAPLLHQVVMADLRKSSLVFGGGVKGVKGVNEQRRQMTETRYVQTIEDCKRIRQIFTPSYCLAEIPRFVKGTAIEIPEWKRVLLAKKLATRMSDKETAQAWADFDSWRAENDPTFSCGNDKGQVC